MSLQAAALRFHSQFETIKSERNGQSNIAGGDDSLTVNTTRTAGTNMTSLTGGVEWELTEQAAWEVRRLGINNRFLVISSLTLYRYGRSL